MRPTEISMNAPDWLVQRGGSLNLGSDRKTWFVNFAGQPQYALEPLPAKNEFACAIRQTINGQRVDSPGKHAASDDAIRSGLEDLRKHLGW
jgi:hypothetical protein